MRNCLAIIAIFSALVVVTDTKAYAQTRPLKKHHQRLRERLLPKANPQPLEFDIPSRPDSLIYPVTPPTLSPDSDLAIPNNTPEPATETTPSQQPSEENSTNIPENAPTQPSNTDGEADSGLLNTTESGENQPFANIDTTALLRNDSFVSAVPSGPLLTIGDFFAPSCQRVSVEVTEYGFDIGEVILGSSRMPQEVGTIYGQYYGFELSESEVDGYELPSTTLLTNYPTGSPSPLPPEMDLVATDDYYDIALETGIRAKHPGSLVKLLGKRAQKQDQAAARSLDYYDLIQEYEIGYEDSTRDVLVLACGAPGSQLGRYKIADQNNPIPQDRIYFDTSFFNSALASASPADVRRFAPGFEKKLHGGSCSIDLRFPMGLSINSTQYDGSFDTRNAEFGNACVTLKSLFATRENCIVSGGLGFLLPTANDVVLRSGSKEIYRMDNRQVRVVPFLASLQRYGDWVWQNWGQFDLGLNGNEVYFNSQFAGDLKEQNYLYLDSSLSRWVYRNVRTGIGWALTGEMHFNQTVGSSDVVRLGNSIAGDRTFDASILNTTFGSTFIVGQTAFSTGYAAPLTNDRGFDGEVRIFVNRFF